MAFGIYDQYDVTGNRLTSHFVKSVRLDIDFTILLARSVISWQLIVPRR
jgi:hypothetical protein